MRSVPKTAGAGAIVGFYVLYFGSVGIILPYLPQYLRGLGFSGLQIAVLLALSPLLAMGSPPLFGHLADRSGRPDRVLTLISFGSFAAFVPLAFTRSFGAVVAACGAYAFFTATTTTLVDSLALRRAAITGKAYAHLRVYGSMGFIVTAVIMGWLVDRIDVRVVYAAAALILAYALWSLRLRAPPAASSHDLRPREALQLLRNPEVALFLAATCLHWIAMGPYNGTLAIHLTALGHRPWVVGIAAGAGVVAEVGVMFLYPVLARRYSPRRILFAAFLATIVRWAGMAFTSSAVAIIAVSLLHGLSFGAFYVAAVGFMASRVPEHLRASGQALFAAVTFGLGGLVGYLAALSAYDLLGGHRLFAVAAVVEIIPALLALRITPRAVPSAPA